MERAGLVREELCQKRVLVPGPRRAAYYAPHRSIVEYLAGSELARQMKDRATRASKPAWALADRKSWDPEWEQVILFAAGSLSGDTAALKRWIQTLDNHKTDDLDRDQLVLAAKSLAELSRETLKPIRDRATRVIQRTFSCWQDKRQAHVALALPALALADGNTDAGLMRGLTERLRDPDSDGRYAAAEAQGAMGAADRPEILERLLELLRDPDSDVRSQAKLALERLVNEGIRIFKKGWWSLEVKTVEELSRD